VQKRKDERECENIRTSEGVKDERGCENMRTSEGVSVYVCVRMCTGTCTYVSVHVCECARICLAISLPYLWSLVLCGGYN